MHFKMLKLAFYLRIPRKFGKHFKNKLMHGYYLRVIYLNQLYSNPNPGFFQT